MARKKTEKKDFSNIVEESFNDGYNSEPEVEAPVAEAPKAEEAPAPVEETVAEPAVEEVQEQPAEEAAADVPVEEAPVEEAPAEEVVEEPAEESEELTESEILLQRILNGDKELIEELWGEKDRATYYLTALQRVCIDIVADEEVITKNEVVNRAFNAFFTPEVVEAAKEEVVRRTIKTLKRQVEKEKQGK